MSSGSDLSPLPTWGNRRRKQVHFRPDKPPPSRMQMPFVMEGCLSAPPRSPPRDAPSTPCAPLAAPHSPDRAVGPGPHRVEGRVSPGQLPDGFVEFLSVKASSPCDVHRPAGAGLPPPQSTGIQRGFWGETGTPRPSVPVKKDSSEFPSPCSADVSVKGHVFRPSSLRLHIGCDEASGFQTRLGRVQVFLDTPIGAGSSEPHGRHTSGQGTEPRAHPLSPLVPGPGAAAIRRHAPPNAVVGLGGGLVRSRLG